MGEVVKWTGLTRHDTNPDDRLQEAVGIVEGCVIVGFDKDGDDYFASSYADGADVVFLLERAKYNIMRKIDELSAEEK